MLNYTKKRRTFRKKKGGAKKNSQFYTDWRPDYGQPGSIAVRDLYRRPLPLDPETSIADDFKRYYSINISTSSIKNALRSLSSLLFSRTSRPATIVETPPLQIPPTIQKQTLRRSQRSRILRRSQRSKT